MCSPSLPVRERAPPCYSPRIEGAGVRTQTSARPKSFGLNWYHHEQVLLGSSLDRRSGAQMAQSSHRMERKQEGSRVQSACRKCVESNSPCNGQIPCHRCGHYSLNCAYTNRAHPTCLECSRNISDCDGESPCQRCRQRALQCVYSTQVETDHRANASAVVASQSDEAWPDHHSYGSRSAEIESRSTVANARFGAREGGLGGRETRHETREPDSYFLKEHNRGIDEDHLAKFKPDKKEWKMDRTV